MSRSSFRRISISQPRSSGITRSFFVRTSWIGTLLAAANFVSPLAMRSLCSPPDADFGVVPEHEPVRRRLHRQPVNPDVLAQQAVFHAIVQIGDRASLEDDAVLDLRVADFHLRADG